MLSNFLRDLVSRDPIGPYSDKAKAALAVLEDRQLAAMLKEDRPEDWTLMTVARYDHLLRTQLRAPLENEGIIELIKK